MQKGAIGASEYNLGPQKWGLGGPGPRGPLDPLLVWHKFSYNWACHTLGMKSPWNKFPGTPWSLLSHWILRADSLWTRLTNLSPPSDLLHWSSASLSLGFRPFQMKSYIEVVTDPGFPIRGSNLVGGHQLLRQLRFKKCLCQNDRIWTLGGRRRRPLDPPLPGVDFHQECYWNQWQYLHLVDRDAINVLITITLPNRVKSLISTITILTQLDYGFASSFCSLSVVVSHQALCEFPIEILSHVTT